MSTSPAPIIRRVSRRDLAQNRLVWLATGGMYAALAVVAFVLLMTVSGIPVHRAQVMILLLTAIAIAHLRAEPPAIDTVGNHAVIASVYVFTTTALWAFQPGGGVAICGAIFIGPLAAVRLQDRRQIAAHMVVATAMIGAVGIAGVLFDIVDQTTILTCFVLVPAAWTLCWSCLTILEAAELQGDELERLVRRDQLTGVGNRRLLDERLEDEIRRHERIQRPLSVIALDLNGFKDLNDAHGHAVGDDILRSVAQALTQVASERDTVVRLGEDEFVLILAEASRPHATRTANAVRAALAGIKGPGAGITSGIGIATYPDDATDPQVLLHVADERLRVSKPPPPGPAEATKPPVAGPAAPPAPERRHRGPDRRQA